MNDEDFKQTVLDYFGMVSAQRHMEIMAQGSDILAKIAALHTSLDATNAALDVMKTNFDKALAGASEAIPAGHSAVLDTFLDPLDKALERGDEVQKKIVALEGETTARIEVIPVPGAKSSPGIV